MEHVTVFMIILYYLLLVCGTTSSADTYTAYRLKLLYSSILKPPGFNLSEVY